MNYQVIKLSNGEDIVCDVVGTQHHQLKITSPLRMETITRDTSKGQIESLALSRWVQPYSDEDTFNVEKNSIVIMTPASAGLAKYYEYVLDGMGKKIMKSPTKKQLNQIEEEMDEEEDLVSSEDLQAILDSFNTKKTIH